MRLARAAFALVALFALSAGAYDGGAPVPPPAPASKCVLFWGEARYGAVGYNHIVHLRNACGEPSQCVVKTDVNPDPQSVAVPPRSQIDVVTWLGSPAYAFTPHVRCKP
jgi:hypothetical protein